MLLKRAVLASVGETFPELGRDLEAVMDVINEEEAQFLKTLTRGRSLLQRTIAKLGGSKVFPGEIAWRLYDTYGFPLDLTQLMCEETSLSINMQDYEEARKKSQAQSGGKAGRGGIDVDLDVHSISKLNADGVPQTNDLPKYAYKPAPTPATKDAKASPYFYDFSPECVGRIVAIRKSGGFVSSAESGDECGLILDQTSFYAEAGGQIYDQGYMIKLGDKDTEYNVVDVQTRGGYIIHMGKLEGSIAVGDQMIMFIDKEYRERVMKNHTGTHVLNYALREVLGGTDQKGSLVAPDKLRFDFTAKNAMTVEEVKRCESICQEVVSKSESVYAKEAALPLAKAVKGLRAVFDETYPDPVRVVSIGAPVEDLLADPDGGWGDRTSVEFCGGTHLHQCGHIVDYVITSEEAIAKGIRRIIAVTGHDAQRALHKAQVLTSAIDKLEKLVNESIVKSDRVLLKDLTRQVVDLSDEVSQASIQYWRRHELRERLASVKKCLDDFDKDYKKNILQKVLDEAESLAEESASKPVYVHQFPEGATAKALDGAVKKLRSKATAVFSLDSDKGKVLCLVAVNDKEVMKHLKANEWVKEIISVIGGKGGGKDANAQCTGDRPDKIEIGLDKARQFAEFILTENNIGL